MSLPQHRRIINGRTWSRVYRPEEFAPIERPLKRAVWADVLFAVVLGVSCAAGLFFVLSV